MSKHTFDDDFGHHKPRDYKKKKKRNSNDDTQDKRAQRLNFKRYIRELQEEDLEEDLDSDIE